METKESIIAELAKENKLPYLVVKAMVDSQSRTVVKAMNEGLYKKIRLPFLGTFSVNMDRVEKLNSKRLCQNKNKEAVQTS